MQGWIFPMRSRPSVLLAALFVSITLLIMSGATDDLDQSAIVLAQNTGGDETIDFLIQITTETGDVIYMLVLAIILLIVRRTRRIGITLMILLVISTILAGYIKCGVDRDRPQEQYDAIHLPVEVSRDTFALFCEGGATASYPSGHAIRSTIIAILLAYALSMRFPRGALLLFIYPASVSISRVLVLQHYPTDVIAGIILGVLLTGILAHQTKLHRIYSKT
ncbi:MAG: phosphatase PAP2 family protein [Cenarchaeum sp. SB0663_bin_5]|nr:phosphatase PAP2 family protein [Cenarchaeum sp. SB0663_bin_5]MYH03826.1 phosphatase PAP2 family protein [Cenarchaeum sp. SB0675_bin_21]MYL11174.1 phosphatase PAP2 family protein [Cenarchaeum sp. SB0669_bin_11]